jgi:hypothetical protein
LMSEEILKIRINSCYRPRAQFTDYYISSYSFSETFENDG